MIESTQNRSQIRVLLLARYDRKGASSRVRHLNLLNGLENRGYTFQKHYLISNNSIDQFYQKKPRAILELIQAYFTRLYHLLNSEHFDIIWIEKEAFAWLPWMVEQIAYLKSNSITLVDFDDDWPARYVNHPVAFVRRMGKRKFVRLLAAADGISVSTPMLACRLQEIGCCRPRVILNGIDVLSYDSARKHAQPRPDGKIVVGWIGTPHTAEQHLGYAAATLNELTASSTMEIMLIGAGDAVPELQARRLTWSEQTEVSDVAKADIGIMPLPDNLFNRGKSGWKLVQFMAAGCPVVASRVGFNQQLVGHGETGYLANDLQSFAQYVRLLAKNGKLRRQMGARAQQRVTRMFGMQRAIDETDIFFREILKARKDAKFYI